MRKFTYSREIVTPEGKETFTASEFDSFEEGQKAVEKGIYDRRLSFPVVMPPANAPSTTGGAPTGQRSTTANPTMKIENNETGGNQKT
jgi:hypothetical protein